MLLFVATAVLPPLGSLFVLRTLTLNHAPSSNAVLLFPSAAQ